MIPTLSPQQTQAVHAVRSWFNDVRTMTPQQIGDSMRGSSPVFDLSGYAGTGKSTILPEIISALGLDASQDVGFVAPTGKAAKVAGEKLRAAGITTTPRTIHSAMYRPHAMKAERLEVEISALRGRRADVVHEVASSGVIPEQHHEVIRIDSTLRQLEKDLDRAYDENSPKFQFNPESDIRNRKLIVVDEASMVGETIADDLGSFNVPILAIGDPGQLPPIGESRGLQKPKPDFFLTEVHRQAADNPIIRIATMARNGQYPKVGNYGNGVEVVERKNDYATLDMDRDVQVICGTHRKRWKLTSDIRKALDRRSSGPLAGEPLIVCKNSRNTPGLVNGSFVMCETDTGDLCEGQAYVQVMTRDETDVARKLACYQGLFEEHLLRQKNSASASKNEAFRARIYGEHLDFGYVVTCHKAQGSQWDEVVVHDESATFQEDAFLWLYTGITRAAKRLTLVV